MTHATAPGTRRRWRWRVEAGFIGLGHRLLRALSVDGASAMAGWLARTVGPLLPASALADANLRRAMPELDVVARKRIIRGAWDNLGRVVAELAHLDHLDTTGADPRITVEGREHVLALAGTDRPGIFVTGHVGNWELTALGIVQSGVPLTVVYRAPNNPVAADLLNRMRGPLGGDLVPKGPIATRRIMAILRKGGNVGLLVDQKTNNGIPARFFGMEAMTTPVVAMCALHFGCPVVPVQVVRTGGARFRVIYHPPLVFAKTGDREADVLAMTEQVNTMLEGWIRERPDQWLWFHRRWPKPGAGER